MSMEKKEKGHYSLDIWEEIVLRLPIKSIARFRCVSATWNQRFTGVQFLKKYFDLQKVSQIDFKAIICNGQNIYSLEFEQFDGNLKARKMNHTVLDSNGGGICEYTRIMGSSNGLVCILAHIGSGEIYLWNPSTGTFTYKPGSSHPDDSDEECNWSYTYYGIGYNSLKKDFKLVEILSTDEQEFQSHIRVYTLWKNNWQRKVNRFRIPYVVNEDGGILVHGCLHWPASRFDDSKKYNHLIIAYDLYGSNQFKEIDLPNFDSEENCYISNLGILNGFLAVSCGDRMDKRKFQLWIMLDYGCKDSWINLFKITASIPCGRMVPIYFMNSGSQILLSDDRSFLLYDSNNQAEPLKKYEIPNFQQGTYQTITCLDSKVSPHDAI